MRHAFILLTMILAAGASGRCVGDELVVYPPVPGLAASEHYTIRVRVVRPGEAPPSDGDWTTLSFLPGGARHRPRLPASGRLQLPHPG